jgi:hypothetical protein
MESSFQDESGGIIFVKYYACFVDQIKVVLNYIGLGIWNNNWWLAHSMDPTLKEKKKN